MASGWEMLRFDLPLTGYWLAWNTQLRVTSKEHDVNSTDALSWQEIERLFHRFKVFWSISLKQFIWAFAKRLIQKKNFLTAFSSDFFVLIFAPRLSTIGRSRSQITHLFNILGWIDLKRDYERKKVTWLIKERGVLLFWWTSLHGFAGMSYFVDQKTRKFQR